MPLGSTEVGLGPRDIVLGPISSPTERGTRSPTLRPMSIVAKRSPISATAELLFDSTAAQTLPTLKRHKLSLYVAYIYTQNIAHEPDALN